MVGTENPPDHSVVWVTVGMAQLPRTLLTYWLSEDKPGSPSYGLLLGRGNPTDMLCYSYTVISVILLPTLHKLSSPAPLATPNSITVRPSMPISLA